MTMHSFKRLGLTASGVLLAASLVACAAPGNNYPAGNSYPAGNQAQGGNYPSQQYGTEYGRVTNIYSAREQSSSRTSGAGAILGAVVGGVLGNQVGGGTGRAAATAIGAVGGAVAGNAIEGRNSGNASNGADGYRIVIGLDQGGQREYDVSSPGDLRVGDRVRLYNGQIARY